MVDKNSDDYYETDTEFDKLWKMDREQQKINADFDDNYVDSCNFFETMEQIIKLKQEIEQKRKMNQTNS